MTGKPRVLSEGTLTKLMLMLHGILDLKRNGVPLSLPSAQEKITKSSAQTPSTSAGAAHR